MDLFGKPLLASLLMGGVVYLAEQLFAWTIGSNTASTLGAVAVGIVVYLALVLVLRMFSREDLERIPGGARLGRLLYGKER